ncbi:MAG: hypothetical protein RR636_14290 [Clostridium sp.]|uniref:hypothetical protein n=1 Tax=Clostridium sp. TaxID=1506 RepID=UPI0030329252
METIVPYHNYIVVTPNGDTIGFQEEDEARRFISGYYVGKIEELSSDSSMLYVDYATEPLEASIDICTELGAYSGDCIIYDLENFIDNIRKSGIFEEEKEELISMLLKKKIDLNVNDYQVDNILIDTTVLSRSD